MGIDDIVIFGITVLAFVVSGIAGARKKRRRPAEQKVPGEYAEPWGRIEIPEQEYADDEADAAEPVTADPRGYIGEHILAGGSVAKDDIPDEGVPPTVQVSSADRFPDGAVSAHTELAAVMEGFDLEKAVIYSEILKPKFEEGQPVLNQ